MFLSGKRNKIGAWQKIQRVAMIVILLFSLTGVENAMADVVETTEKQMQQNITNIKNDVKDLQNKITNLLNNSGEIAQSEFIKPLLSDMRSELMNVLTNPLGYDWKNLEGLVNNLADKGKNISAVQDLTTDVRKTIKDIKNVATVIFTAPVGLSGGYGQTGLKIEMDPLTYRRKGEKEGSTSIKATAEFQLPFSITGDGGNTKIGFIGEINLAGENNSSKLHFYAESTNQVGMTYFPILENKVELGVDKESYVEVDCNGFKRLHLVGAFRFSSEVIYNAKLENPKKSETSTSANSGEGDAASTNKKSLSKEDSMVTASFVIDVTDLEDIIIETEFETPFKIRCTGDIVYTVKGVVADLSTVHNAKDFQFPPGYNNPFKGSDENYWTGFALKTLEVNVGDEIPFIETLGAYNMLIDETGISGWFGAGFKDKSIFDSPTISGKVDTFALGLASNKVIGGTIGGNLKLKMLTSADNPQDTLNLHLNGTLYSDSRKELCYSFEAKINDGRYGLPFLKNGKTQVNIASGTSVSFRKENNPKYKPDDETCDEKPYRRGFFFVLNGDMSMDYSFLHVDNLQFQNLKFSTCEPYFGGGTFALNSAKAMNLGGLEMELTKVSIGLGVDDNKETGVKTTTASIGAGLILKLIGDGKGVSIGGEFHCYATKDNTGWKAGDFKVDEMLIDVDFSAFHLGGKIGTFENDPVYGKGFDGAIQIKLDMLSIDVHAEAKFGKLGGDNPFKYWFVFAGVDNITGVTIFPPSVMLQGVSLGLFSRMYYKQDEATGKIIQYYPNPDKKFGVVGGINLYMAQPSLLGAQVKLFLVINNSGGVSEVSLLGNAYMLGSSPESAFIKGWLRAKYDFENRIFTCPIHAEMGVAYLTGDFDADIFATHNNWHFYVGSDQDPVSLRFADIINTKSYFMLGHDVPTTLAPLDPRITELFGVTQSTASGKTEIMERGNGFAFGTSLCVDCGFSAFIYVGATLLGGLDVLVNKMETDNCENTKYRGSGRAYVYLDLGSGVKPRKKKFEFIDFAGSAQLYAEFPKPLYMNGDVAFRYSVLGGLFKGTVRTHFEAGKTCENNDGSNPEDFIRPIFDIYEGQNIDLLKMLDSQQELLNDSELNIDNIDAIEGLTPEEKEKIKDYLKENSDN